MKKIIAILSAMLVSFSLLAQKTSQGDFRFGIVTGLNIAFPVGSDMQDFSDQYDDDISELNSYPAISSATGSVGPRFGGHFGGVFDVFFIDNLAINFGTIFSMKGFCITRKIDWDNSYFSYSNPVDKQELTISTKLNYFDIPIGVKYVTPFGLEISGCSVFDKSIGSKAIDNNTETKTNSYW